MDVFEARGVIAAVGSNSGVDVAETSASGVPLAEGLTVVGATPGVAVEVEVAGAGAGRVAVAVRVIAGAGLAVGSTVAPEVGGTVTVPDWLRTKSLGGTSR